MTADDLVDLDRFPLHRPDGAAYAAVVAGCREQLAREQIFVLRGFLRPQAVAAMADEATPWASLAHRHDFAHNAWFGAPDPAAGPGHPANLTTSDRFRILARDLVPADSLLGRLYGDDRLTALIGDGLGIRPLHRDADPFQGLNVSYMGPGDELGWHYDGAEFVVSLLLQEAGRGGAFTFVPNLRSETDENLEALAALYDGSHRGIRGVGARAGDLVLFRGRFSPHRVTPVEQAPTRIIALLSYDRRPDRRSTRDRNAMLFGARVHEVWDRVAGRDGA